MLCPDRFPCCQSSGAGNRMEKRLGYWNMRILYICLWISDLGHLSRVLHNFLLGDGLLSGCGGWASRGVAMDSTGT